MICEHKLEFISANAGVDESNVAGRDNVLLLPKNRYKREKNNDFFKKSIIQI